MAARLKMYLIKVLRELTAAPTEKLLAARCEKFRRMGSFFENGELQDGASQNGAGRESPRMTVVGVHALAHWQALKA